MVEESYSCGKMIICFDDQKVFAINNANDQRFLTCYVGDCEHTYTHIESFVSDYMDFLQSQHIQNIQIMPYEQSTKRKSNLRMERQCHKKRKP